MNKKIFICFFQSFLLLTSFLFSKAEKSTAETNYNHADLYNFKSEENFKSINHQALTQSQEVTLLSTINENSSNIINNNTSANNEQAVNLTLINDKDQVYLPNFNTTKNISQENPLHMVPLSSSNQGTFQGQQSEPIAEKIESSSKGYGGLLLPQVRSGTNFSTQSDDICGGTLRGKPHFITTQNAFNGFKWLIETPSLNSECLFRISQDVDQKNDTAYKILIPQDDERNIVSTDGWFICGKVKGVEKLYFTFPEEVDCDRCILEWIWKTPDYQVRQCSDISVMSTEDERCKYMCQNDGICHKGTCICPIGYTGEFCEIPPGMVAKVIKQVSHAAFYIILAIIFALGIISLIFFFKKKKVRGSRTNKGVSANSIKNTGTYQEFDKEPTVVVNKKPEIQLSIKV